MPDMLAFRIISLLFAAPAKQSTTLFFRTLPLNIRFLLHTYHPLYINAAILERCQACLQRGNDC